MTSTKHAAILVAVVLAATACGGGDEPAEETPPPAQAQPDSAAQAAEAARAQAAEEARQRDVIGEMINFGFDRQAITATARPILDRKVQVLQANTAYRIRIEGHCDPIGPAAYNMALGMRRANAARQYLVDQGIPASRIETVSRGETQLLDTGTTREAYARNRRAEFVITAGPGAMD